MSKALRRADYRPLDFKITKTDLELTILSPITTVKSKLTFERTNKEATSFKLDGQKLTLVSLKINGQEHKDYTLTTKEGSQGFQDLVVDISSLTDKDNFIVEIENTFNLDENKTLSGIYKSGDVISSQCESHGFRLITFYFDRPDNLSIFDVRIIAEDKYQYILSNGNPGKTGTLENGMKFAEWHDPFPKPCYLFAMVVGNFDVVEGEYITKSGRKVDLKIYAEIGKKEGIRFALDCIKRAMKWDEDRFGLEYDLDLFQIVAVSFFNMGAMENKGLNIFNDGFLIGTKDTSTDRELNLIDAVIAHEYFHNWTGDRVTCRDWFQLTLKEGLTVFRDQEYTSDTWDRISKRLEDADMMETAQFAEDAGPSSHPIRPERVEAQDNFYTVTVYEKGSEVIRMIHTLLGEEKFQAGMRLYFKRHDGKAVTCDDFVDAMQDASGVDLSHFRRWYSQSGTPVVTVKEDYNPESKTLKLKFSQYTPPTHDQETKEPLTIMLKTEFLDSVTGKTLTGLKTGDGKEVPELIVFEGAEHELDIIGLDTKPVVATNLDFSSPVKLVHPQTFEEQFLIATSLNNLYGRFKEIQNVYRDEYNQAYEAIAAGKEYTLSDNLKKLYQVILDGALDNKSLASKVITFISAGKLLAQATGDFDPIACHKAVKTIRNQLSEEFKDKLNELYEAIPLTEYEYSPEAALVRSLRSSLLFMLKDSQLTEELYFNADNFQDKITAFSTNLTHDLQVHAIEESFIREFQGNDLVLDAYLSGKAGAAKTIEELLVVTEFPSYDFYNPNRSRAHLGGFIGNFPLRFSEEGIKWNREMVEKTDAFNPQAATNFLRSLLVAPRLAQPYKGMLVKELEVLKANKNLSVNVSEMVNLTLDMIAKQK